MHSAFLASKLGSKRNGKEKKFFVGNEQQWVIRRHLIKTSLGVNISKTAFVDQFYLDILCSYRTLNKIGFSFILNFNHINLNSVHNIYGLKIPTRK